MKKIIIVSPFNPYLHKGGLENYVLELYNFLRSRFDVKILTSESSGENVLGVGGKTILSGTYPILDTVEIFESLNKFKPDVVILNTRFFYNNYGIAKHCKEHGIPYIHIEHGTGFVKTSNPFVFLISRIYDITRGKYVLENAKYVFAVSTKAKEFCKSLSGRRDVKLLYPRFDYKFFTKSGNADKKSVGITFIGRLIYAKGVQDLIEAFRRIPGDNLVLNIVGGGNYEKTLRNLASGDSRIKFLGEMNRLHIRNILNKTDIFVNPSYSEGMPYSVLEAASMKCAVVATDVGGTREIIRGGVSGYLIGAKNVEMLASKTNMLINDKHLRNMFGNAARKSVLNFVKTNRKQYDTVLETLSSLPISS